MVSFFTLPKPFEGHINTIQRNAIGSWRRVHDDAQVIALGDEPGLRRAVDELGVDWSPLIDRNQFGTPLVNSAFARAEMLARHDILCYANADIIFFSDLIDAVRLVSNMTSEFLLVGQCVDISLRDPIDFRDSEWEQRLRSAASLVGRLREPEAIDFFVFRRGAIDSLPPFAVGRPGWDNWLIWRGRQLRMKVINVTGSVLAIHQHHDYRHVKHSRGGQWEGPEADQNRALLGFNQGRFSVSHSTHRLTGYGLAPNRTGGLYRRLRVDALLLRPWTLPLYRALRRIYRFLRGC